MILKVKMDKPQQTFIIFNQNKHDTMAITKHSIMSNLIELLVNVHLADHNFHFLYICHHIHLCPFTYYNPTIKNNGLNIICNSESHFKMWMGSFLKPIYLYPIHNMHPKFNIKWYS